MRPRCSFSALVSLAFFAITSVASVHAQDIFVTPIPNAPFTGVIKVERVVVQRDGSIIHLKTMREIGRDARGRIFNQYRTLLPVADSNEPQVTQVLLYDPQTRASTALFPQQRRFRSGTVNRPPETLPPTLLDASTLGNIPANEFTKKDDLGNSEMEGLLVHGVRQTQTIPAESSSTGKEIVVTDEYWYSSDLRINMLIKHNDPRTGTVTMTVSQVNRWDPDPALLEIPQDFQPFGAPVEVKQGQEKK